jgi:uncharacterized membrane protein (DUF106 family)
MSRIVIAPYYRHKPMLLLSLVPILLFHFLFFAASVSYIFRALQHMAFFGINLFFLRMFLSRHKATISRLIFCEYET